MSYVKYNNGIKRQQSTKYNPALSMLCKAPGIRGEVLLPESGSLYISSPKVFMWVWIGCGLRGRFTNKHIHFPSIQVDPMKGTCLDIKFGLTVSDLKFLEYKDKNGFSGYGNGRGKGQKSDDKTWNQSTDFSQ